MAATIDQLLISSPTWNRSQLALQARDPQPYERTGPVSGWLRRGDGRLEIVRRSRRVPATAAREPSSATRERVA